MAYEVLHRTRRTSGLSRRERNDDRRRPQRVNRAVPTRRIERTSARNLPNVPPSDRFGDQLWAVRGQDVVNDLADLFRQHRHPRRGALADEHLGRFTQREELTLDPAARSRPA